MRRTGKWLAGGMLGLSLMTGTGVAQSIPAAPAVPTLGEAVQPVEAMIESAWLADPLTFQYVLKAQVTTQGIELRGLVPTQMLKQRALAVAQSVCTANLVDQLRIQPNMEILLPGLPGPDFADEALGRLAKVSAGASQQVTVQVGVGGVVTLTGQASSLEEKLRLARSLRGVPGCAAVRNNLVIGGNGLAATSQRRPAPLIRMEPTPTVQVQTEPIRVRVEPPRLLPQDSHVKQAVASAAQVKKEIPKQETEAPTVTKSATEQQAPTAPPSVAHTTLAQVTPAVKPDVSKQVAAKPQAQGTPVQIIFH